MNDPRERVALLDVVEPGLADQLDTTILHRLNTVRERTEVRERVILLWKDASALWGDPETAMDFLFRKHPMLGDNRPIDMAMESDEGAQRVHDILGRLRFGSAA